LRYRSVTLRYCCVIIFSTPHTLNASTNAHNAYAHITQQATHNRRSAATVPIELGIISDNTSSTDEPWTCCLMMLQHQTMLAKFKRQVLVLLAEEVRFPLAY
jgi:hypothetical protein